MKKLLLFISTLLIVVAATAQTITIDSVRAYPVNPNAADPVYLHVYGWSPNSCALAMPPTVTTLGMNHLADFCYQVGMLTVITPLHDSVYLFTGPSGTHTATWNIEQNATDSTTCDQAVSQGSTLIVVSPVAGIIENGNVNDYLAWDGTEKQLRVNQAGLLSIFSADGRLIYYTTIRNAGPVKFPLESEGVYFARLQKADGTMVTLKFFVK